jgi:hypothetical protein
MTSLSWLASRRVARSLGIAALLSIVTSAALLGLGGKGGFSALMLPFVAVGALIAWRQPKNPVGSILLLLTFVIVATEDAAQYDILRYRRGYDGLPLGRVAVFLGTPGAWMWLVVFLPLPVALFPDGRLSGRWRRALWGYLVVAAIFVAMNWWQTAEGLSAGRIEVNAQGQLASTPGGPGGQIATALVVAAYLGFCGAWVMRLVLGYRRSTGDARQQLKWLACGGGLALLGLVGVTTLNSSPWSGVRLIGYLGLFVSLLALPTSLGVGILKYRLYEVDRLISRTISYAVLTGLLVGVFAGLVLLTTRVLPFSSPVGVAASTLAAAGLFAPLRSRLQRLVDRRFNRARYDAEATVAAFGARLRDAIDVDAVLAELSSVAARSLEPATVTVWLRNDPGTSPS